MLAGDIEKPIIVFVAVIHLSSGVSFLKIFTGLFAIFFYDASFRTRNSSLIIEGIKRIALINWNGRNMQ